MPLPGQVDGNRLVPCFGRQMRDRRQRRQHGGVGNKSVEPLPPPGNRCGKARNGRCVLHIQLDHGGAAAGGADGVVSLFQCPDRPPGDDQFSAGRRGRYRNRPSDPACGTSHKDKFARQIDRTTAHYCEPPCETRFALSPEASRIG